jgi:hypothetical protein
VVSHARYHVSLAVVAMPSSPGTLTREAQRCGWFRFLVRGSMAECAPVPRWLASECAAVTGADELSRPVPIRAHDTFAAGVGANVSGLSCRNSEVLAKSSSSAS